MLLLPAASFFRIMGPASARDGASEAHLRSMLKTVKYFSRCSGWTDGCETFVRQNCALFRSFDPRLCRGIGEQDCETNDPGIHEMIRRHAEFEALRDKTFSEKLKEEFPELDLEALAATLVGNPGDKDAAEIQYLLLMHEDFASFGQFMRKTYESLRAVSIHVFHDGENCYLGNTPGLMVDQLIREAKAEIKRAADLPDGCPVQWNFYHPDPRPQEVWWHPTQKTLDVLHTVNVTFVRVPSYKSGLVDTKLKDDLGRFAREHRDFAERYLVVIVSGDSDFTGDIAELRAEGFRTMILHGPRLKKGVDADIISNAWFPLLQRAGGEPPALAEWSSQTLPFSLHLVPHILLDRGRAVKEMQSKSGACISIDTKAVPCKVDISGTVAQVQLAAEMITAYIDSTVMEVMALGHGTVGVIVGKGGKNVKTVQLESGACVWVDQTADGVTATIVGTKEQVGIAKAMLQSIAGNCLVPN